MSDRLINIIDHITQDPVVKAIINSENSRQHACKDWLIEHTENYIGLKDNFFELGGDYRAFPRQVIEGSDIVIFAVEVLAGQPACRAVFVGIEHDDVVAQGARGNHEHAPELTAAEHAEFAAGKNCHASRPVAGFARAPRRAAIAGIRQACLQARDRRAPASPSRTAPH